MLKPEEYVRYRDILPAEEYHKLDVSKRVQMNVMLSNMELSRLEEALRRDRKDWTTVWRRLLGYCDRVDGKEHHLTTMCISDCYRMIAHLRKVHVEWDRRAKQVERLVTANAPQVKTEGGKQ